MLMIAVPVRGSGGVLCDGLPGSVLWLDDALADVLSEAEALVDTDVDGLGDSPGVPGHVWVTTNLVSWSPIDLPSPSFSVQPCGTSNVALCGLAAGMNDCG